MTADDTVDRRAEQDERLRTLLQRAHGHWTEILRSLGVDERILRRVAMPCPVCGGGKKDCFQYTDRFGEGNYHCRKCGPGGSIKLLRATMGWRFPEILDNVERCLGRPLPPPAAKQTSNLDHLVKRLIQQAKSLTDGDEVTRYLQSRNLGMTPWPAVLRCHPCLGYFEKDAQDKSQQIASYAAMLALVQGRHGEVIALHRTYVKDGAKISGAAKKLLSDGVVGAAVRLYEPTDTLALTEGIETALAVHLATGLPVWSALNSGNLRQVWIPATVQRVWIYGDNDASFEGQSAAYDLARRIRREDACKSTVRAVAVEIPRKTDTDWADVWREMVARGCRPAIAA